MHYGLHCWRRIKLRAVFELETVLAFGVGAGLVTLAPMVRRLGNPQLGDSMHNVGRSMAKSGIKLGVAVAGAAGSAARTVAQHASEAAESFGDLVAEARSELDAVVVEEPVAEPPKSSRTSKKRAAVTDVTVE